MPTLSSDLLFALLSVFVAVALAAGAILMLVIEWRLPERRRLKELAQRSKLDLLQKKVTLTDAPDPRLQRLMKLVRKSPKEMSRLRQRMLVAGFRGYTAPILYATAEMVLPIVAGGAVLYTLRPGRGLFAWFMAGVAAFAAYAIPGFVLGYFTNKRKKQIRDGLPDALDLMIVCVESGSGLDQAIVKTSDELALAYPILAEELSLVTTEIRAGKSRLDAFRNLAARTKVDDVRSLTAMLVQTDRFGTSISQALRQHADTCRTKRRQRAEERAAKLGVKLAFPLVFCLFPAFYVVTLAPAALKIYRWLLAP